MRRIIGATVVAASLIVPLAACQSAGSAPSQLVVATGDAEPTCLDPHVGGNWPQALIGNQFLESLFSRDADGNVIPWLASAVPTPAADGLSWDVPLREGVTFTDGTAFDAEAVVANMKHLKDPATKSSTGFLALAKVQDVVAVDPRTVRFVLSEPDSALLESLAQTWLAIESPAGLARTQEENCLAPIGTGPFVVETWTKQQSVTFTRNDKYSSPPADAGHEGPAAVQRLEWRFIPDSAARLAALQSGEVDVIDSVQPDAVAQFRQSGQFETVLGARPGVTARIELNSTRAPFDDAKVREAFSASADIDAAVQSLYFGTLDRSTSVLSSSTPFAVPHPEAYPFDQAAANRLLDEAGWTTRDANGIRTKNGVPLTVKFPVSTNQSIPAEVSLFEQIQQSAKQVGFDVQIEQLDLSTWYERSGAWEFDAIVAPYSKDSADVLRIVYDSAGTVPAPSGYHANNTGLKSPELDATVQEAARVSDPAQRAALYATAQDIIAKGHYVVPLYDQMVQFAVSPKVQGFRLQPNLNLPSLLAAHK